MARNLQYQDRTTKATPRQENNLSLDVSIVAPDISLNMRQLVLPPRGEYLGEFGTSQVIIGSSVDLEPNVLRDLANQYLVGRNLGIQRLEEAKASYSSKLARTNEKNIVDQWMTSFGVAA